MICFTFVVLHQVLNNNQFAIPFYILYAAFVPIHGKITTTIYRIGLRYRQLNDIICTYIAAGKSVPVQSISKCVFLFWNFKSIRSNLWLAERLNCFALDNKGLSDVASRLFKIHEMLGQVVDRVSSFVIHLNLFINFSSVFCVHILKKKKIPSFLQWIWINHIIFADLQFISCHNHRLFPRFRSTWEWCNRKSKRKKNHVSILFTKISYLLSFQAIAFIFVQIVWPLVHIIQIFSIIEPCHLISSEVKHSINVQRFCW